MVLSLFACQLAVVLVVLVLYLAGRDDILFYNAYLPSLEKRKKKSESDLVPSGVNTTWNSMGPSWAARFSFICVCISAHEVGSE